MYADVDRSVWPAAEQSVRAQLDYLSTCDALSLSERLHGGAFDKVRAHLLRAEPAKLELEERSGSSFPPHSVLIGFRTTVEAMNENQQPGIPDFTSILSPSVRMKSPRSSCRTVRTPATPELTFHLRRVFLRSTRTPPRRQCWSGRDEELVRPLPARPSPCAGRRCRHRLVRLPGQ